MEIVSVQEHKNNIVKKHNNLVWEARYRLSKVGIKVVAMIISMITVNDDDFKQYGINIADLKELMGSTSKDTYEYSHSVIKELLSKSMKIGDEQFAWISYGKYVENEGYMVLEINRHLKPYLLQLKSNFINYNIVNILPLKSGYIIRLYELLKSKWSEHSHYKKSSKSYKFDIKIDWLREQFEIPNSYQYSSHIKERILDKAKKQLKEHTDIQFDYTEQKIGRKVDRLIITIKPNKVSKNNPIIEDKEIVKEVDISTVHTSIICLQGIDNVATTDYYEEYTDGSCSIILNSGNKVFLRDKSEDITHNTYLWDMIRKG